MTILALCALALATLLTSLLIYRRHTVWYFTRERCAPPRYTKERGRWHTWPPEQRGPHAYLCMCDACEPEITDYNASFN